MSLLQDKPVDCLFFNGPVQNGDFTFTSKPGKAVGIRIAEALNHLLGARPVPHLWNTVRLDGDLRYRRHAATGPESASREGFEAALLGSVTPPNDPPKPAHPPC